jgi:hypothetical protein
VIRSFRATVVTCAILGVMPAPSAGQAAAPAIATPAADPKDVASPDAIITALYDVISGPAGQKRNWDRFHSLFVPGARLIPTGVRPDSTATLRIMTPGEYAMTSGPRLEASGFFEREIGRVMNSFGNMVNAYSAYDSKRLATDEKPFARGINSIELFNDGKRWWIVSVYWASEREGNPIPEKYLKPDRRLKNE